MLFGRYASRKSEARYPSLWEGLVGAWCPSVQGPSGVTLWDLSGQNRHGALVNAATSAAWARNAGRYAINLDGVDDHMLVAANGTTLQTLTVAFWIRKNTGSFGSMFQWSNTVSSGTPFMLFRSGDIWYVDGANRVTATFSDTVWTHFAVTLTQSHLWTFYQNGIAVGTYQDDATRTHQGNAMQLYFGNGFASFLAGQFDDMSLYRRALSASEVRTLASRRGSIFEPRRSISFGSTFRFRRGYSQIFTTGVIG